MRENAQVSVPPQWCLARRRPGSLALTLARHYRAAQVTPDSLRAELIPTDESNLVMRALKLYAERVPTSSAIHCRLHKRIPAQGGLGGGSSDAATALHAANRLAGFPVSQDTLIEYAATHTECHSALGCRSCKADRASGLRLPATHTRRAPSADAGSSHPFARRRWAGELGSDCGFFLSRGSAYCTGRGELVSPVDPLSPAACYLIKPATGLSTPAVFKELGLQPGEVRLPGNHVLTSKCSVMVFSIWGRPPCAPSPRRTGHYAPRKLPSRSHSPPRVCSTNNCRSSPEPILSSCSRACRRTSTMLICMSTTSSLLPSNSCRN